MNRFRSHLNILTLTHIYIIYIYELVLVCEIQECSMSYRQSEMYKLTTYLKDLPLQSVSSEDSEESSFLKIHLKNLKILFR